MSDEPVVVITGGIGVLLNALNAFVLSFAHLTVQQTATEAGLVAAATALVLAFVARSKVKPYRPRAK